MSGRFKILHQNRFGYVAKCACCNEVQFAIGNLVSHLPQEAFMQLFHAFQEAATNIEERVLDLPNGQKILLQTPMTNLFLSLSIEEFAGSVDLLEQARLMLLVGDLLKQD